MQRSNENVGANTPKAASKIVHQSGNVNVFVLGTAMVIAAMWLVFQHDAASTPTLSVEQAASAPIAQQLATTVALPAGDTIAEVVVTAPRLPQASLVEMSEGFERPAQAIALVEPKAPKTYWQSPS